MAHPTATRPRVPINGFHPAPTPDSTPTTPPLQGTPVCSGGVSTPLGGDGLLREQLVFAQRAFVNAQELVRFMDQKAAFLLATVGIATSALSALALAILRQSADVPKYLVVPTVVLALVYVLLSVVLIWTATAVFAARTHGIRSDSNAPGLLFPLIVLKKHDKNEDAYRRALASTTFEELLAEYSNQIMEVSNIYAEKQKRINLALLLFQVLIVLWTVELLLLGVVSVY